jgi:hypothetical protein
VKVLRVAKRKMDGPGAQHFQSMGVFLFARLHCFARVFESRLPIPVGRHVLAWRRSENGADNGGRARCQQQSTAQYGIVQMRRNDE